MITYDTTTTELESKSGILLISQILNAIMSYVDAKNSKSSDDKENQKLIKNKHILKTLIALLATGHTHFADVEKYRDNTVWADCLHMKHLPAQETLRLYLEREKPEDVKDYCRILSKEILKICKTQKLETVLSKYIPIDFDVTPMDNSKSNKEGVSRTYKGFDGYAPLMVYLGGYCLGAELRPGKTHCQKNAGQFIKKSLDDAFEIIPEKDHDKILCRFDCGHDKAENIELLDSYGVKFILKKNKRNGESNFKLLKDAKLYYDKKIVNNKHHTITYYGYFTGKAPQAFPNIANLSQVAFKITEQLADKNGQALLIQDEKKDIEVEMYWTNLVDSAYNIDLLYHDHGTSEQYHSEIKTDMGFERLASGKFNVNEMLLATMSVAYNILRAIDQLAMIGKFTLPEIDDNYTHQRKRVKTVLRDIIYNAAKVQRKGRNLILRLYIKNPWAAVLIKLQKMIVHKFKFQAI